MRITNFQKLIMDAQKSLENTLLDFDEMPVTMTIAQLAYTMQVSTATAYEFIKMPGFHGAFRIGKVHYISRDALVQWIKEQTNPPKVRPIPDEKGETPETYVVDDPAGSKREVIRICHEAGTPVQIAAGGKDKEKVILMDLATYKKMMADQRETGL